MAVLMLMGAVLVPRTGALLKSFVLFGTEARQFLDESHEIPKLLLGMRAAERRHPGCNDSVLQDP